MAVNHYAVIQHPRTTFLSSMGAKTHKLAQVHAHLTPFDPSQLISTSCLQIDFWFHPCKTRLGRPCPAMSQPDQYERGRRPPLPPLPPPPTRSSAVANPMPQTQNVQIQVGNLGAEKTLKRGLEARQVSITPRLAGCLGRANFNLADFYDGAWGCV